MNLQATSVNIMLAINKLTPDIKNKAFDPDWFLLRQQIEQSLLNANRAGMTEAAEIVNEYQSETTDSRARQLATEILKIRILSARDKKETI